MFENWQKLVSTEKIIVLFLRISLLQKTQHAYLLVELLELFAKWHVVDRRSLCSFDYHVESEVMRSPLGNPKVKDVFK